MKYRYNVITPLGRVDNFQRMLAHLASFRSLTPLHWYPVFDEFWSGRMKFPEKWITPMCSEPKVGEWFMGYYKINWALDLLQRGMDPKVRFIMLNDDDFLAPDFFEHIDEADGDLLICSMRRGYHNVGRHECSTLIAAPENVKIGSVASEQLIVSGSIAKDMRLGPEFEADGALAVKLCEEYKATFVPEAEVWFNYLEPGRWDPVEKALTAEPATA